MDIWDPVVPDTDYTANQAKRLAVFDKIAPAGNWKAAIWAVIDADEFADANKAAIWFTGAPIEVARKLPAGKLAVKGAGYYAAVGA